MASSELMKTTELKMNRRVLLCKKRFIMVTSTATVLISIPCIHRTAGYWIEEEKTIAG
jgi:hypothetical protein